MAKVMCNRRGPIMQLFNEWTCNFECNFVFPSNEPTGVPGSRIQTNVRRSRVTNMAGIRVNGPCIW